MLISPPPDTEGGGVLRGERRLRVLWHETGIISASESEMEEEESK